MTKKSQRRRRRRCRQGLAPKPLDKMHQALGELLTEMSRVELQMLMLMDLVNEASLEYLFDEYAQKSFGPKIDCFEKWCNFGSVPEKFKPRLHRIYTDLEQLRQMRNPLVHDETWEGVLQGNPRQPYRIGIVKENLDYLEELERGKRGEHVFDIKQAEDATNFAAKLRNDLQRLRNDIAAEGRQIT